MNEYAWQMKIIEHAKVFQGLEKRAISKLKLNGNPIKHYYIFSLVMSML